MNMEIPSADDYYGSKLIVQTGDDVGIKIKRATWLMGVTTKSVRAKHSYTSLSLPLISGNNLIES